MGRKILAVIVALITAVGIILISEMISTATAPTYPKNLEYMSREEIKAYIATLPVIAFVVMIVGHALAAFAGGFIATKMGRRWSPGLTLALIVGVLLTVAAVANFLMIPGHPAWFVVALLICYIPSSLIGYRLAR